MEIQLNNGKIIQEEDVCIHFKGCYFKISEYNGQISIIKIGNAEQIEIKPRTSNAILIG